MSKPLRDSDYLDHIGDAIARIKRYTAGRSEADFLGDEFVQDGVIRNLEIIGEAATKLSPELKASNRNVPRGEISGMRNRLIHGYISVNLEIVWSTVQKVLPNFLDQIESIRRERRQSPQ